MKTCLPLMQEITGAKPVRDANFHRRVVHGEKQTHLTQNQAALDVHVSRRPFSKPPKHFERCACSVSRPAWCNSGWGLHFLDHPITSQSSQRPGRFHKPAVPRAALGIATTSPPCGSPQASFVRKSGRGSTGRRLHPFRSRSPTADTRRRERRQCRCESCREHHLGLQALK